MYDESNNATNDDNDVIYSEIPDNQTINNVILSDSSLPRRQSGITWYKSTFLVVNAALGAGLLNFPQAFNETGGLLPGNLTHFIFVCLALLSLIILAICAFEKNSSTLQEVVKHFCGTKWSIFASLCITIYCFITCITFLVIIGDQFDRAFASFYGSDFCFNWYMNRKFTIILSALFLIFPCCFKRIDGMEFMSYVGVISVIYLVIVIVVEFCEDNYISGEVYILDFKLTKFFNALPTICFGYQCHVSSVPIFSCLQKKEKSSAIKASICAIICCFLVYTIAANFGYLTFGSLVNADVLLDYNAKRIHVLLAVIFLGVKSWTTYPILMFCVREAVSDIYLIVRGIGPTQALYSESLRRKVIAVTLWLLTILFAIFIPSLNVVIRLLGSLAGLFILILPGMCYLNRHLDSYDSVLCRTSFMSIKSRIQLFVASGLIILGVFASGLAFTMGLEGLWHPIAEHPICIVPEFSANAPYFTIYS